MVYLVSFQFFILNTLSHGVSVNEKFDADISKDFTSLKLFLLKNNEIPKIFNLIESC